MADVNHETVTSGVPDAKRQKTSATIPEELVAKLAAKQQQHVLKVGERIASEPHTAIPMTPHTRSLSLPAHML